MERQTRRYLLALALVLYDDLSPWDRDGLKKSDLYRYRRNELILFCATIYKDRLETMDFLYFRCWWIDIEHAVYCRLYGGR